MTKYKECPEDIQRLLRAVYDDCFNEDQSVRERQIRLFRKLKLLWENYNRVWFSEVAHDWRVWDETENTDGDQAYYDKPVNVFRAYLESIIAALSVTVPAIKCYPDDADNTLDLATCKAGDKIGQLIYRHNDAAMTWLHGLFSYQTEGCIAFRNYTKSSEEYGTYDVKETQEETEEHNVARCSQCGYVMSQSPVVAPPANGQDGTQPQVGQVPSAIPGQPGQLPQGPINSQLPGSQGIPQPQNSGQSIPNGQDNGDNQLDKFNPDDDDALLDYSLLDGMDICPACQAQMNPDITQEHFTTTRLVGVTKEPKSRVILGVWGGLYIKVAVFARDQAATPYLIYSHEEDYAMTCDEYDHLAGNSRLMKQMKSGNNAGGYTQYEQWGRLSPQYLGEFPQNVVTVNEACIRPGKFNILPPEDAKKLKKLFPDGVRVVYVNDEFAEAKNHKLDDEWTLLKNPMSDYLYFVPPGEGLVSIQEITNDLISLTLQTIEHGIGQTFADSAVLDFNAYEQVSVNPGQVFPVTPKTGKSIGDSFHELRTASLSAEVMPFSQNIQSLGQLASGALPSLFGGIQQGMGETASQYSMSRAQAQQRLQNTWKLFTATWKTMFGKAIPQYISLVQEDERHVEKDNDGNFINTFIRKAELEGKIGRVELEANENLPMTWSQRKDLLMNLMTATNPEIIKILNAPENASVIHEALGLVDFYMPGEDDIIKQMDELRILLNSEPIPNPMDPMNPEQSSVQIDPLYDNHQVEFEQVRKWAVSEAGQQTKVDNPDGYRNALLHGKLHFQQVQMQQQAAMAQQAAQSGQSKVPNEKPNPKKAEAPITGDSNGPTS